MQVMHDLKHCVKWCLYKGWDHFDASEAGFKELYEMYRLVTEQLGQPAIVIDADDLLQFPGRHVKLQVVLEY